MGCCQAARIIMIYRQVDDGKLFRQEITGMPDCLLCRSHGQIERAISNRGGI